METTEPVLEGVLFSPSLFVFTAPLSLNKQKVTCPAVVPMDIIFVIDVTSSIPNDNPRNPGRVIDGIIDAISQFYDLNEARNPNLEDPGWRIEGSLDKASNCTHHFR